MSAIAAPVTALGANALDGGNLVKDVFGGLTSDFHANLAPIQNPVSAQQLQGGYDQTNTALTGQQQLAALLAGQNGAQNQSNVFNQQQVLANALQNQANGVGPNPAMAQLANQTGNNMAGQAALMAGQRGAGANAGLIARQAGMQGGAIQQQAAGQGAAMQAQQQLAAQQQLMAQQQAMQGVAGQQVANQMGAQNSYASGAIQNQGQLIGGIGDFNKSQVSNYGGANDVNAKTSNANAAIMGNIVGGVAQGAGAALMMADGGEVQHLHHVASIYHPSYAQGGQVQAMVSPGEVYVPPEKVSAVLQNKESVVQAGEKIPGKAKVKGDSLKNDTVPMKLEEGGIVIPRSVMESDDPVKAGTKFLTEALKKNGKGGKEESDFHSALKKAAASRGAK